MRRPEVAHLWARGDLSCSYCFFWTCRVAAGWGATEDELSRAEKTESTSWLQSKNPLFRLRDGDGKRKVGPTDIFLEGEGGAYILRVAISPVKEDIEELERRATIKTQRTVGFSGNRKNGGAPTRRKAGSSSFSRCDLMSYDNLA
jgi:hypothetical protein